MPAAQLYGCNVKSLPKTVRFVHDGPDVRPKSHIMRAGDVTEDACSWSGTLEWKPFSI